MKIERLENLAQTYGADLRRWPADQRAFAESLIAADPAARAVIDDAAGLDALLNTSVVPSPSEALTARVLAAAPQKRGRGHLGRAFWFIGAGWAAAACAGVVAGVGLTTHLTADQMADAVLYQSTLNGMDDTEVLG